VAGAARYRVYAGDRLALSITDEPGALVSSASPSARPGEVQEHAFLTAAAHLAAIEGELRKLLDRSTSTADFLERLTAAGYRVERAE
jgi:hypothetical protein